MPIINSILDNDLYKFTMQNAILEYRPKWSNPMRIPVEYRFHNRSPNGKFNTKFFDALIRELEYMKSLIITEDEYCWFKNNFSIFGDDYFAYLRDYRFNPNEISVEIHDGELELSIRGPWERTILWEVPLMALISELYFIHCDKDWTFSPIYYTQQHLDKISQLQINDVIYCDFGTRRRRSYAHQDIIIYNSCRGLGFLGTSNVHFAHKYKIKAVGTMAHEWIMGISALEGLKYANKHALEIWSNIYRGNFGIALTDTFGTNAFLKDFDSYLARLYDGVRHDSGDPFVFGDMVLNHYGELGIDHASKMIVFSDGLDHQMAIDIAKYFKGNIKTSFGIGTNFTNDYAFENSKPLNIVIKLYSCNNIPVVKLSDVDTKQVGDPEALRVANWTFT